MDERMDTFLLLLGFSAFGGIVGAAFGASAGALYWASGRTSGTAAGLAVERAIARVSRAEPTRGRRGAVVGAVDGFLFLGLTSLVSGFLMRRFGLVGGRVFLNIGLGGLALMCAAVALGILAYVLTRVGVQGLAVSLPLAVLAAFAGLLVAGWSGYMVGILGGLTLGTLILLVPMGSVRSPKGQETSGHDDRI